jgi:hypothetical protein
MMNQPSSSSDDALKASVFQRLHPRIYLERFLAENVRPDSREFTAFREIGVNVGEACLRTLNKKKNETLTTRTSHRFDRHRTRLCACPSR